MRIFVAVNHVKEIGHRQTTALLIAAMIRQGHTVHLADVDAFSIEGDLAKNHYSVRSAQISASPDQSTNFQSTDVEAFAQSKPVRSNVNLGPDDLIFIRTNPGRDIERTSVHDSFLNLCFSAKSTGIRVVNDPENVRYFASKAALAMLDQKFRPAMIVSHQPALIAGFIHDSKIECVVKPAVGSRGQDVIRVQPDQENLDKLIGSTFHGRGLIAQHFVHSDDPGDRRVVVVGGRILEIDDQLGGIHRRPAAGEFRSNIHLGATAHRLTLTTEARKAVEQAAKLLNDHGIWLAGVDLIDDQIIEFNVFSTGGLYFAEEQTGLDFSGEIVRQLLRSSD